MPFHARNRGLFKAGTGLQVQSAIVVVPEITDSFDRVDADAIGGNWDSTYLNSTWALSPVSSVSDHWKIRTNKLRGQGTGNVLAAETSTPTSGRNAYARVVNHENFATGNNRQFRVLINVGRDGSTAGSYYYVGFGRIGGVPTLWIGKWWNNADSTLTSVATSIPVGAEVRIRHDGAGKLYADIAGTNVLTVTDTCYLRATGVGLGFNGAGGADIAEVDDFHAGTWGTIPTPSPWYVGDAVDTDTISSGLWTPSNGASPSIGVNLTWGGVFQVSAGLFSTHHLALVHGGLLSADQYIEWTSTADSSVLDNYVYMRSTAHGVGYVAYWDSNSGGRWIVSSSGPGGTLATAAQASPGVHRVRFEIQGTALRLYHWSGGTWVLKITTSSTDHSSAGTARLYLGAFGGAPQISDVVVGNL